MSAAGLHNFLISTRQDLYAKICFYVQSADNLMFATLETLIGKDAQNSGEVKIKENVIISLNQNKWANKYFKNP